MRRNFGMVAIAIVVVALAGCASAASATPTDGGTTHTDPAQSAPDGSSTSPTGLIGLWRVSGAAGQNDRTWLRITGREVQLWDRCGVFFGSWSTAAQVAVFGFSEATDLTCAATKSLPVPAWIEKAVGYRSTGVRSWDLLDRDGSEVAHLRIDGHPPTSRQYLSDYTEQPVTTAKDRAELADPKPLPGGATPFSDLLGRWVPLHRATADDPAPFIEFDRDGTFRGSDGCNSVSGVRWETGPGGILLTGDSASTAIGCDGSALVDWATPSGRTALIDGRLTFFDHAGRQLGQAVRPKDQQ